MALMEQKKNRKGLLQLGQKLGLDKGTTQSRARPATLGQVPMMAEISYMNRKREQDQGSGKPVDKVKNKVARSAPGGSKEML
jgi:hypothetical protein